MDASDPRQWQRLAPIALVFLIVSGLQKFIRENLYVFLGAGAGFAFTDWLGVREVLLGGLAVVLFLLVGAIIFHRRFRYRLEDDAVRLRRGIWVRRELRVRFARVQNIQISRPFYFRPFGLVRFSLETPGAAEKEVELPGIPEQLAGDIRDRITRYLAEEDQHTSSPDEEESLVLHEPGNAGLFTHGVASNQIWLLAGAAAYLYSTFGGRLEERLSEVAIVQSLFSQLVGAWHLVALALLVTVVGLQMLSGLLAIIRFHDFRLLDRVDRVVASGGLLDRRESTARREKITGIVAGQTMVGRLIGCWHLIVRQASSTEMDGMEGQRKQLIVPGMRRDDLSLIDQLLPGSGNYPRFKPISAGYRQIFWIRIFLVLAAGLGVMVMLLGRDHTGVLILAGFIPLALAGIHLRWRHWGWARRDGMLWVRQGLLGQQIDVVPMQLVQQARVGQSPYQFRRDLANLELTLPQGDVTIPFIPFDQACELANEAVYVVETSMQHQL